MSQEGRTGPRIVPDEALDVVRQIAQCAADAQVEYLQAQSRVEVRVGRRQINICYGGLESARTKFGTILAYTGPMTQGYALPVAPAPLDAFAHQLQTDGFVVIRAISDGVADCGSTPMYEGNFIVFQKGDLIVTIGWRR